MKQLIFFLALILSFSGCSEFHHMHYRKVKKVPAKGFVETRLQIETNFIAGKKADRAIDSLQTAEREIPCENAVPEPTLQNNNPAYIIPPVVKKKAEDPVRKKINAGKPIKFKKPDFQRNRIDGTVALIIFFLFLGVALMVIGGAIFVGAFYMFSIWLLLLGLAIFFLGLLPFLGLLSLAFGGGKNRKVPRYDEK